MPTMAATRRPISALVLSLLLASGCSVYRVRDGGRGRLLDGIPFFPHVGVCRQETAYIQPVYRAAVQAGTVTVLEASLNAAAIASPEMRALRAAVTAADADPASLAAAFDALAARAGHRYDPLAPPTGLFLASNTLAAESQVDYRAPLYLNVSRPWVGSAAADARLAPDGTLTQAGAEVKDTTLDALLSWIPAKELLSALASSDRLRALAGAQPAGGPVVLQLVLEPQFITHRYTVLAAAPCTPGAPPIPAGHPAAMYRREHAQRQEK